MDCTREDRLGELQAELDELQKSVPAHSLSQSMALRLEELEETLAALEREKEDEPSGDR